MKTEALTMTWSFRLRGPKGKAAALDIQPEDKMQSFCGTCARSCLY
jgi:hypothetical protein